MYSMMSAKSGTASTKAAKSRCSCATIQMATRLPVPGKRRYSASSYFFAFAVSASAAACWRSACSRGVSWSVVTWVGGW